MYLIQDDWNIFYAIKDLDNKLIDTAINGFITIIDINNLTLFNGWHGINKDNILSTPNAWVKIDNWESYESAREKSKANKIIPVECSEETLKEERENFKKLQRSGLTSDISGIYANEIMDSHPQTYYKETNIDMNGDPANNPD